MYSAPLSAVERPPPLHCYFDFIPPDRSKISQFVGRLAPSNAWRAVMNVISELVEERATIPLKTLNFLIVQLDQNRIIHGAMGAGHIEEEGVPILKQEPGVRLMVEHYHPSSLAARHWRVNSQGCWQQTSDPKQCPIWKCANDRSWGVSRRSHVQWSERQLSRPTRTKADCLLPTQTRPFKAIIARSDSGKSNRMNGSLLSRSG